MHFYKIPKLLIVNICHLAMTCVNNQESLSADPVALILGFLPYSLK